MAAVMVHGADGKVSTLCLDLDTSKALQSVVDADAAAIGSLLASCGLKYVADHSPSGGRHIYIPLAERLPAEDAREIVEALGTRFHSLDPGPHQNLTDGCIRPPGSLHKSMTGHQVLDTPLAHATTVMLRRNPTTAVATLRRSLAASIHQVRLRKIKPRVPSLVVPNKTSIGTHDPGAGSHPVSSPLRQVARTGIYDASRYQTPSHARMAVLTHLANFPITLPQIRERLSTDFSGLSGLYSGKERLDRLLSYEWNKAKTIVGTKNTGINKGAGSPLKYDTEPSLTHSGGASTARSTASVMAEINDLENILYALLDQRLAKSGREGISLRLLLRAVIGFARSKGSLRIDVGCRSFAIAMGKHHGTIARLLPRLESLTEGLVSLIEKGRGKGADVYLLTMPEQWQSIADSFSWRKGKIYGIRPVFRALGDVAALVYEAIERSKTSPNTADIVRATGIGRTAVDHALMEMAELAMIERHRGAWLVIRTTNLTLIAEWLGVQDEYEEHKRRVRAERMAWHSYLERFENPAIGENDLYDREKEEWDPWNPQVWDEMEHFKKLLVAA